MLIIKSIILNYDGIMIKPEFSSQKNVIILCDNWYTKQNLVSIVEEYPNLDLIGNARADSVIYAVTWCADAKEFVARYFLPLSYVSAK